LITLNIAPTRTKRLPTFRRSENPDQVVGESAPPGLGTEPLKDTAQRARPANNIPRLTCRSRRVLRTLRTMISSALELPANVSSLGLH